MMAGGEATVYRGTVRRLGVERQEDFANQARVHVWT
jgi:hypothetical protein